MTDQVMAARAALHMWEEPCLSGKRGSGAVFFSGCPLGCFFCQNRPIALGRAGTGLSGERLADIFLDLEGQGAHNINLVTPTHFVPTILPAIDLAREKGLTLPIVYNTAAYETRETVKSLKDHVEVFLPDLKYDDPDLAERYSRAPDYPKTARAAIEEMVKAVGPPVFDEDGMMIRGVIVRHLVMPGHTKDAIRILTYLHETYGNDIYISLMNQYTPMPGADKIDPLLGRRLTKREYEKVIDAALKLGAEQVFYQEGGTASESFIPAFDGKGIL